MVNEKRFTNISNELDKFKILLSKDLSSLKEEIEPMKEFILTAQTDLGTIVKEYEINGIPLGYDRGKKADYIEGL
jgi:hypothetical protein